MSGSRKALDSPSVLQLPEGSCTAQEFISQRSGVETLGPQPMPGYLGQCWVDGVAQPGRQCFIPPHPLQSRNPLPPGERYTSQRA